jgi:hypothetical protein
MHNSPQHSRANSGSSVIIAQVGKAAHADYQQTDHQQDQVTGGIIPAHPCSANALWMRAFKPMRPKKAMQQFQTAL